MATVTRTTTYNSGDVLTAASLNAEFNNLLNALALVAGDISSNAITTVKINDLAVTTAKIAADAVTAAKIADDVVDDTHLNLAQSYSVLASDSTEITATSSLGTTVLSLSSLAAGTYLIFGQAGCYLNPGADTNGIVLFELNNGSAVLGSSVGISLPSFIFDGTTLTGSGNAFTAGFIQIVVLAATTTINLAAYKTGGITTAVASGRSSLGYIRIAS